MSRFSLKNYHLVRDPFDTIWPYDLLKHIVATLASGKVLPLLSSDTQQMLQRAMHHHGNEEIDKALEWKGQHFVASPISSFLPLSQ